MVDRVDLRLLRYFVAVVEERHVGRAAVRLSMTQPPLSRAIRQLEDDLGVVLLHRLAAGVEPTRAGATLYAEATVLLEQAGQARERVAAQAGPAALVVGTLAHSAGELSMRVVEAFRRRHPDVPIRFREADFSDPTTGLRQGLVDVALTRAPFDETGISLRTLHLEPVGALLRTDDALAGRDALRLADLDGRPWFQLPDGTDPVWREYWNGATPVGERPSGPVVRTVNECTQAVRWNGMVGLSPRPHVVPDELTWAPLVDMPHSRLVVAWPTASETPLVRSFVRGAVAESRAISAA